MSPKAAIAFSFAVIAVVLGVYAHVTTGKPLFTRTVHDTITVRDTVTVTPGTRVPTADELVQIRTSGQVCALPCSFGEPPAPSTLTEYDSVIHIICPSGAGPSKTIRYPARLEWEWSTSDDGAYLSVTADSTVLYQRTVSPKCSISRGPA